MRIFINKCVYVVLIFTVVLASGGRVVCHRADGHVTVKSAFDNCCRGRETQNDRANVKSEFLNASPESCGPCIDTPASDDLMKPLDAKSSVQISTATLNMIIIEKPVFSSNYSDPISYSVSPFFTPLRTIVLLT